MLLQANDYRWLHEHQAVELQIGGSDQWGNITAGRRPDPAAARRPRVHGLTWPLLTARRRHQARQDRPGRGSGSTRRAPARTSSSSTGCRPTTGEVERFLRQFTLLPVARSTSVVAEHARARPSAGEAQRALAREVTALVHGARGRAGGRAGGRACCSAATRSTASTGGAGRPCAAEVPTAGWPPRRARPTGVDLVDAARRAPGLAPSKGDARRPLEQGGRLRERASGRRRDAAWRRRRTCSHGALRAAAQRARRDHAAASLAARVDTLPERAGRLALRPRTAAGTAESPPEGPPEHHRALRMRLPAERGTSGAAGAP